MARFAMLLLLVAGGLLVAPHSQAAQTDPTISSLAEAYAAGDHGVVVRAFGARTSWQARARELLQTADRWRTEALDRQRPVRDPLRLAFLLDTARTIVGLDLEAAGRLLRITREMAIARAGTPGDGRGGVDDHDTLEVTAHRIALAILFVVPSEARAYLRAIEPRLTAYRRFDAGRVLVARLDMMPALLAEADTRPFVVDTGISSTVDTSLLAAVEPVWPQPPRALASRLSALLDLLSNPASRADEWEAERRVRRSLTLLRLGRPADARDILDAQAEPAADLSLRYWALLIAARSHAVQGDSTAAMTAYEAAVEAVGVARAQTALVALAATEFLSGRRDRAEAWARQARVGVRGLDPWWEYWYGDQRFLGPLMNAIRSAPR